MNPPCAESGCHQPATWSEDDQAYLCDLHWLRRFERDFAEVLLAALAKAVAP